MFYKMQSGEMIFQLIDEQVKEDYAIWQKGFNTPFRDINGISARDIYFMKPADFAVKYPNCRKDRQFIRDIVVYDAQQPTQYLFGFKKTANDDLSQFITNQRNIGVNPLEILLKLRKTGSGLDTTYSIVALERIGIPQNVIQSQLQPQGQQVIQQPMQTPIQPIKSPETSPIKATTPLQQRFELPKQVPNVQRVVVLTDKEKVIYGWACESQEKYGADDFVSGFLHSYHREHNERLSTERVMDIYNELYNKS